MGFFAIILKFQAWINTPDIGFYIDHNWRMEQDRNKWLVPSERYRIDARYIREPWPPFLSGSQSYGGLNVFLFFILTSKNYKKKIFQTKGGACKKVSHRMPYVFDRLLFR